MAIDGYDLNGQLRVRCEQQVTDGVRLPHGELAGSCTDANGLVHAPCRSVIASSLAHDFHVWIGDRTALVPVTIEVPNKSLTFSPNGDLMKARVGIYGRVTGMLGEVVYEFEDLVAKEYRPEQLNVGLTMVSLYQKVLSLEAGRYKLELVLKDLIPYQLKYMAG